MALSVATEDINGESSHPAYDRNPDLCPLCKYHVKPKRQIASYTNLHLGRERVQIIFRCTNEECDRFFIASYIKENDLGYGHPFRLYNVTPKSNPEMEYSETIKELSPSFVEIYNQAIAAESSELDQIAGIGLRKALEFLIKDFAINQNPKDEEKIKGTFLGTVIKTYIDDTRLKSTAERATWLGNDETHYVRKWIDKDINDLKLLIKLSVNWIENVLLTEQYSLGMIT
jgi:hypothetical protein